MLSNDTKLTLDGMSIGRHFVVCGVRAPVNDPEWGPWLEEIGFIPGEEGRLMARGLPGGDPLVVRIGLSTFAMRRAEAACVLIEEPAAKSPQSPQLPKSHRENAR